MHAETRQDSRSSDRGRRSRAEQVQVRRFVVTVCLLGLMVVVTAAVSLSVIVPVAVSVSVTSGLAASSWTVNVSGSSRTASSSVATVNCCVSPAIPANVSTATTLS